MTLNFLRIKIGHAHAQYASRILTAFDLGIARGLMGPCSKDLVSMRSDGQVIADKFAIGLECLVVKRPVAEDLAIVGGAGQRYGGGFVVFTAVIKNHIHGARCLVHCHPLKKLVPAIVDGIVVDRGWSGLKLACEVQSQRIQIAHGRCEVDSTELAD